MIEREASSRNDGEASGWSRQELTLRLSRRRLAKLKQIAAQLPAGATPTDAIDHAIECARFGSADYGDLLVQIAESIDAVDAKSDISQARVELISAQLRALAASVEALRALISAVAHAEE